MVLESHLSIIIITKREACGQSIMRLNVFELYIEHVALNKSKTGRERERLHAWTKIWTRIARQ